jgi:hypothetical protein
MLSLYEDGLFGDTDTTGVGGSIGVNVSPAGSRVVNVRVRKTMSAGEALIWPIALYSNSGLSGKIGDALRNSGWDILAVKQTANFGSGYAEWQVTANVLNQFTDSDVLNNIRGDIASVVGGNVSAAILSTIPAYVNAATGQLVTSQGQPIATAVGGNALDSFLASLGGGLGLSTPVVLLAGGVLLVLFLKR